MLNAIALVAATVFGITKALLLLPPLARAADIGTPPLLPAISEQA